MAITSYDDFIRRLRKAIQLPKEAIWFELRAHIDEAVTVKCAYYPNPDSDDIEFGEYYLVKICDAQYKVWRDPHLDGWR